jgi:CRISPR-associated exonuclease Cas4
LRRQIRHLKKIHSIQTGTISYSDLTTPSKPLFSKRYRITGKPDYIVIQNKHPIPVEVKTGNHIQAQPHHIFQLAAYCQMVEETYHDFVPYGILVYPDTGQQLKLTFDPKMRFQLEKTINHMRTSLGSNDIYRNHDDTHRCQHCSMRKHCTQKIR